MEELRESDRGLVVVYTGNGKGKTTAAMGLALRAAGYGQRVLVIQFVKTWFTGEKGGFEHVPNVEFVQAGKGFYKILGDKLPDAEHTEAAEEALALARAKVSSGGYEAAAAGPGADGPQGHGAAGAAGAGRPGDGDAQAEASV